MEKEWPRQICRGLFLHCPPFPLVRSTDRKSLVRASTVLVLSIVHPSFQPRLNHGKMLHNHFPSIQQPRSNHDSTMRGTFAAHPPHKDRVAASRSLSFPRRLNSIPTKISSAP
jgi:hypothetical protein